MTAPVSVGRLVDCHAHLRPDLLADEGVALSHLLDRAEQMAVAGVVFSLDCAGGQPELDLEAIRRVAERHRTAVGIALGFAPPTRPADLAGLADRLDQAECAIRALAGQSDIVAIGEVGLDYYWPAAERRGEAGAVRADAIGGPTEPPGPTCRHEPAVRDLLAAQRQVFQRWMHVAAQTGLALVVHERDAYDDVAGLLQDGPVAPDRVMLHCFSAPAAAARQAAAAGWRISIPSSVVDRAIYREVAQAVDLDVLVIETDSPYHSPIAGLWRQAAEEAARRAAAVNLADADRSRWLAEARRAVFAEELQRQLAGLTFQHLEAGRWQRLSAREYFAKSDRRGENEPALVRLAAAELARLKAVAEEAVCAITFRNACRLFPRLAEQIAGRWGQ